VVRQAVDAFALEQTSNEILSLMGAFKKQWDEFLKKLEVVGKRIEDAQKEYEALTTTRKRQLERPLSRIEDLRVQKGSSRRARTREKPPERAGIARNARHLLTMPSNTIKLYGHFQELFAGRSRQVPLYSR